MFPIVVVLFLLLLLDSRRLLRLRSHPFEQQKQSVSMLLTRAIEEHDMWNKAVKKQQHVNVERESFGTSSWKRLLG